MVTAAARHAPQAAPEDLITVEVRRILADRPTLGDGARRALQETLMNLIREGCVAPYDEQLMREAVMALS